MGKIAQSSPDAFLGFIASAHPSYIAGWFQRDLARRLQAFSADVAARRSPRLLVLAPPRFGMTLEAGIHLPAWHLGQSPGDNFVYASNPFSVNRVERLARGLALSGALPANSPARLPLSRALGPLPGGSFTARTLGEAATGEVWDLLVVDQPVRTIEEAESLEHSERVWGWFTHTALTRVPPGGGALVIMNRWGHHDLAGRILADMADGGGTVGAWEVVTYQAIPHKSTRGPEGQLGVEAGESLDEARWPLATLHRLAATNPHFAAMYQQIVRPCTEDDEA